MFDGGGESANYGDNDIWEQVIRCGEGNLLQLRLTQLALGPDCKYDFLKIYDGPSSDSPSLFISSCSTPAVSALSPLVLYSTSLVYIKFTSDTSTNGAGYSIKYTCTPITTVPITGKKLYDTGGAGGQYGNNENTLTRITCPIGNNLELKFTELDIDGTLPSCSTDSIRIIIGGVVKNTYCGTLTGSSLPQVSVGASSTLILFASDSSITRGGYTFDYECVLITSGKLILILYK